MDKKKLIDKLFLFEKKDCKDKKEWRMNCNFLFFYKFRSFTTQQLKDYCKEKKILKIKEVLIGKCGYTLQSVDSVSNKLLLLENIYEYLFDGSYDHYEFDEEEWEEIKEIYYKFYHP